MTKRRNLRVAANDAENLPLRVARDAGRVYLLAAGVPLLLTLAAYLPSLPNGFVYDDRYMVAANPFIGEWSFIWKSFTHDLWWFSDPLRLPRSFYYRPFEDAWLALNYHLFGLNPPGWHATMIVVQLVGVYLVYRLAQELTRQRSSATSRRPSFPGSSRRMCSCSSIRAKMRLPQLAARLQHGSGRVPSRLHRSPVCWRPMRCSDWWCLDLSRWSAIETSLPRRSGCFPSLAYSRNICCSC